MKEYPTTTAIIEGHTDSSGNFEQNMRLSQQRAESVLNYLVENAGLSAPASWPRGTAPPAASSIKALPTGGGRIAGFMPSSIV
jgi:OOP family OmpA-OmpF porin